MAYQMKFQEYGLIRNIAQHVLYQNAHLVNVRSGMDDPKEYHTVALMSQILGKNIFHEDYFAVLPEQPPSPNSRKRADIVVNYITDDGMHLSILCIGECKRTKTTQAWSLAGLENQALDYGLIHLQNNTDVTFVYTATMAGCRMRLWKCEWADDKHATHIPFWGDTTPGDWKQYIDVGGDWGDVETIKQSFDQMKTVPPTARYGQTQDSYGTGDFTAKGDDDCHAGPSSFSYPSVEDVGMMDNAPSTSLPPETYDDAAMYDDGGPSAVDRAGQVSYKKVFQVALTRIPHTLHKHEYEFQDRKGKKRSTHESDWTEGEFDGHRVRWYHFKGYDYYTRYKF